MAAEAAALTRLLQGRDFTYQAWGRSQSPSSRRRHHPNEIVPIPIHLALDTPSPAITNELGRMEEARATVAQLLALDPTLTVSRYRARSPADEYETGAAWARALERAGLPE